jgi:hypothetical protein
MPNSGVMSASANPAFIAGSSAHRGRPSKAHADAAMTRQVAARRSFNMFGLLGTIDILAELTLLRTGDSLSFSYGLPDGMRFDRGRLFVQRGSWPPAFSRGLLIRTSVDPQRFQPRPNRRGPHAIQRSP